MYFNYVLCLVAQSCLTLCNSKDSRPPDSSVHGISQARILEWVPFPSLRDLPDPGIRSRDPTWVSCFAGRFFTAWATRETLSEPKAFSFQCMTEFTTNKNKRKKKKIKDNPLWIFNSINFVRGVFWRWKNTCKFANILSISRKSSNDWFQI